MEALHLQRLVMLDENVLNPSCHVCDKECTAFLITEEELIKHFTPENLGFLMQKTLIRESANYKPKLILFLCRTCCKGKGFSND